MKPTRNILKSSESLQRNLDRMHYAPSDDIFNKLAEEQDIDPENILKKSSLLSLETTNGTKRILLKMFPVLT